MILHSIVQPEYIFPYSAPINSITPVKNGYLYNCENNVSLFSTNPFDYINGKYLTDNQIFNEYYISRR